MYDTEVKLFYETEAQSRWDLIGLPDAQAGGEDQLCMEMDSMAMLLEAAAEDIRLIDCLGPEDSCLDPTSADGLKPV